MSNTNKYKYKGNLGSVSCSLADDPNTFREVTLEELLSFEDCWLTCTSEDNVWQYYFVQTGKTINEGYHVKIKCDIVMRYLGRV